MEAQEDERVVGTKRVDGNVKHARALGSGPNYIHIRSKGIPIRQQLPMQIDPTPLMDERGLRLIAKVKRLPLRRHVENGSEAALNETVVRTLEIRQPNQQVNVGKRSKRGVVIK